MRTALATCLFLLVLTTLCPAQRHLRRLALPVKKSKLVEISVNGEKIRTDRLDYEFTADEDWPAGLALDVKNISGKAILHYEISLIVPKHGNLNDAFGVSL